MFTKTAIWSGILGAAVFSMTGSAQADHFQHRHRLVDDIERLHEATDHFYRESRVHAGYSHLTIKAKHLLASVDHFCDTARRGWSQRHLRFDFQEVSQEMRHVQSELRRAWHVRRNPHMLRAWAEVERAFDRVYYDLYEQHCGFIQYHCTIGGSHHHGHGHAHGGPRHHVGHSGQWNAGHRNAGFPTGHGSQRGVQVHIGGNGPAPIWAQLLREVLK